ncbi:Zinc finger protein 292 [Channa argus]|uniref:Zinc finger protein 292 n=1 Tax=Channa argus TaxID=215402 RepID=A0A6G1PEN6_CHAAH|nr:Zinc finger protein 292 [Channa argus]
MAEEGRTYELEGLENQLQSLLSRYSDDGLRADSKTFCSDFRKIVEEHASHWQVPLPQLRILEIALIYFARASIFFTSNCDHVLHTLSSLALSVFELLLFFDQKDFGQEPLKHFVATFQECHLVLARHQNVHLLQVEHLVQDGGPWASMALQAILSESTLPQNEVDDCISSEVPVFFELRVRYLLSCERISEAMALAKCCARHPTAGQYLFFLQVYLTWLYKNSQHDRLLKEVADLNGNDAVHIICSLECEEEDDLLLALSRAFLSQQLRRGDTYYLCDLVFIWSKLHSRLKTSKQTLLEESHQLMLSATNVNSIFPFIRAILQELGEDGVQFCVELCASALESCLPCDLVTKSLIYKTIAGLLPNDLEVSRACALLVFFLERTFEAYKMVYLLYMHPDQEYHVDYSPIRNHVRFETLQVLKKDLCFDPEFWNLFTLRTNCLKLMNEKVVSAAHEEIMEDKWISNYCTKEPASQSSTLLCPKGSKGALQPAAKKRHHKEVTDTASKRLKVGPGKTQLNADQALKKKGKQSSRPLKEASSKPLRRSFWQLDRIQDNGAMAYGEHRRTTRLSEKNPPKRRIRKPKWLLEDSGTLEANNVSPRIKKHGLKHQKYHPSSVIKRAEPGQIKNNVKHKPSLNSHLKASENNKPQRGFSLDSPKPSTPPQVILELSLPDNELMGTFTEDTCNRQRGFPQVLLYKPTVKLPATSQPVKTVHRREVVLRARDASMFVLQLHCYARRQKGKGKGLNIQASVSTITRSSVQGSPPKEPPRELGEKQATEIKGGITSETPVEGDIGESPVFEKGLQAQTTKAVPQKTSSAGDVSENSTANMKITIASHTSLAASEVTEVPMLNKLAQAQTVASVLEFCVEPAVEMKVTIASQTATVAKVTQSPDLEKVPALEDVSKITVSPKVLQTTTSDENQIVVTDEISPISSMASISNIGSSDAGSSQSQDDVLSEGNQESCNSTDQGIVTEASPKYSRGHVPCENDISPGESVVTLSKVSEMQGTCTHTDQDSTNQTSALALVTEMVTELAHEGPAQVFESNERQALEKINCRDSIAGHKPKVPHKTLSSSSCSVPEQEASTFADVHRKKGNGRTQNIGPETPGNSEPMETPPESEESKLEFSCTFCDKVFKGSRVVAHAMFHYRKDECMFCGTVFKDDLLAMMHLSDHLEKLKKSKETVSTPKTSKPEAPEMCCGRRSGRLKKSDFCPKSLSLADSHPSESRKLRSNDKPVDGQFLQEKKPHTLKHLNSKPLVSKVNGHFGKKKELRHVDTKQKLLKAKKELEDKQSRQETSQTRNGSELPENHDVEMDSSSSSSAQVDNEDKMETESLQHLKSAKKQNCKDAEDDHVETQGKVCCPVNGCTWFTDLAKNRVALLYHALEDHHGEVQPLELAFRVGNSRCSICMRVLWSFEHFLHHVERHRQYPRHPCLHQGCNARFKTGMEMRRHARRHSPLQAVCCVPGCSQLFICLWALNLHEREHYASKSIKPEKSTNVQTHDKHSNAETGKKHQNHKSKDANTTAAVNQTERKHKAPVPTPLKQNLKGRTDAKESNVLNNFSKKDASAQSTVPNLRSRQKLRRVNTTLVVHKVVSSSLLKHHKVRHKFKKKLVKVKVKGPKKRGRPPKSNKSVGDETTTAGQNHDTIKDKTALQKTQLASNHKTESSSVRKEEEKQNPVDKATETLIDESKSNKSLVKQVKKNHIQQKGVSKNNYTAVLKANSQSVTATSAHNMKKLHKVKKRFPSKDNSRQTASSSSSKSKKHKVASGKANTNVIEKKDLKESELGLKKPSKSKFVVELKATEAIVESTDEEGKAKTENVDSAPKNPDIHMSAISTNSVNKQSTPPSASEEKTQRITTEEQPKKSHIPIKGRTEKTQTASSDSGKAARKHKNTDKEGDKGRGGGKQARKNNKSVTKKIKGKSEVQQQIEANAKLVKKLNKLETASEQASDTTPDSADRSLPAVSNSLNEKTCTPAPLNADSTQKQTKEKKLKKTNIKKASDPNKANQKRKNINIERNTKVVESNCQVQPLTEVQVDVEETSVGEETKTFSETLQSSSSSPGYSLVVNGQAEKEVKSTVRMDILAKYSRRPYMRLPPTAYLDEKYITMPKRRKEISFFQCSQKSSPPEQASVTTALQRQRCANCFATFNSAEELQSHLELQKCSNLFGFDSDDEGNS